MNDHFKILIIEPSPIVREGLTAIIESVKTDVVLSFADTIADIFKPGNPDQFKIIFVNPHILNNSKKNLNKLLSVFNKQNIVGIISNHYEREFYESFADNIFINDKMETIENIILKQFRIPSANNVEKDSTLSERETDVLKLLAIGKSNKEIADELFISIHTVISHRKNISGKLGVKSTAALVIYAVANGLIDVDGFSE